MARSPRTDRFSCTAALFFCLNLAAAKGGEIENHPWPFAPRATPAPNAATSAPTPRWTPIPLGTPYVYPSTASTPPVAPNLLAPRVTPPPVESDPPRPAPLVEKRWEELTDKDLGADGKTALGIEEQKWKHAETENFILHFRRVTEAEKVAREVEYDLWFVAKTLGATKERYHRKSHVFIFQDEDEWQLFLSKTTMAAWAVSFAQGDELFLNVRRASDTGRFDSNTLAHETTHAVVARLYPRQRWPVWLSEGFAEYMGGASVAARKGQTVGRHQARLRMAEMPLEEMEKLTAYPEDQIKVAQLYQTGEKLVRFLMDELPREKITRFIDAALTGLPLKTCVLAVYGEQLKDWPEFERRFARFAK